MRKLAGVVVALFGVLALFGSTSAAATPAESSLIGMRWALKTDQTAYFELDLDGRLSGSDSCNRMMGSFTVLPDENLDFGLGPALTMMYCGDVTGAQSAMRAALSGSRYWHRVDSALTLSELPGEQVWEFVLVPLGSAGPG
ncbi:hypothetical protein MSTE_04971 [Mycobacteroides stephanolepidis]|uniref:DUF306 domain-containing protein n=1 Tax=[Mycobacterium] stephanolepidis TaxID=1520670 RepID=A0A1Z4F568_9MYCO|nr:META domain-containing protein [[Mycobacterium] stephanolepidis]BAY00263.1 hypothetical protein MSTE_04971 [[Mycobacterium] stephanolepidis]